MLDTSARLLRLLSLLQSPTGSAGRSATELAERLGVTTRTVRRDVDRLRTLGYPVDAAMGATGGYRLAAGTTTPPLLLDDDEAVAVTVALRSAAADAAGAEAGARGGGGDAAGAGHGSVDDTALRVLAKLEQVLPPRLRTRVATLQAATVSMPATPGPAVEPATLSSLATACREHLLVRFAYTDRDGGRSERRIEPLRLVSWGRRWYLVGYDLDRDDWRTFRADRIALGPVTGHGFAPRPVPGGDVAAFVTSRVTVPPAHRVRVRFAAPAEEIAPGVSPGDGLVEAVDERSCVATLGGDDPMLLVAYLGMFCVDFEVLEPDELKAAARTMAARLTRSAGPAPA